MTLGHTMRTVICHQWGGVDELTVGEAPVPEAAPGEVLIRAKATAVNYAGSIMAAGRYQTKPALPFSPGGWRPPAWWRPAAGLRTASSRVTG